MCLLCLNVVYVHYWPFFYWGISIFVSNYLFDLSQSTCLNCKNKIPLFPFKPITCLHCRPNGRMSVPLSSIGAPPEDNAQATSEAAVTRSDSRRRAERHEHQMVKVNHLVRNNGPNFNLQKASIRVPPEGRDDVRSITEVLSFRVGGMQPQRTAWNTWNPTVRLPPLHECPKKYSS